MRYTLGKSLQEGSPDMILDCTQKYNASYARLLGERSGERVVPLREMLERGEECELFSGSAYILIADFKTVFSRKFIKNFKKLSLKGSRMLYCVFVCTSVRGAGNSLKFSQTRMYKQLADMLLRSCGLVLFGYDCICGEEDISSLSRVAAYARDARPFDWNGEFPRRAKTAQRMPAAAKA